MEREEVSEGGSGQTRSVDLDVQKLGDGTKDTEAVDKSRTFTTYAGRRRSLASIERRKQADREGKRLMRLTEDGREYERGIQREWRDRNREHLRQTYKDYRSKNKEKLNAQANARRKTWTEEDRQKEKEYQKAYRQKNAERRKELNRRWVAKNSDYVKEKQKAYLPRRLAIKRARRAVDPIQRLKDASRTRVSFILRKAGIPKFNRTFELVGCTPDFLKSHIEKQFKPGMSWENYGQWEIDHIRPIAAFDISKQDQLFAAFHYANCQPLWKIENRIKNCKVL